MLTGDEASREAAVDCLEFVLRRAPSQWDGLWGSRILGWSVENLVDGFWYLGDPRYLQEAGNALIRFEQHEQTHGGNGYVINTGATIPNTSPWQHNIVFNAAVKYVLISGDRRPMGLLSRMRDWFRNDCLVLGTGPFTARGLTKVHYHWDPNGATTEFKRNLIWPMIESLSLSAILFWNDPVRYQEDLSLSYYLFEEMTRYHQGKVGAVVDAFDAGGHSPITLKMAQFPNSESKVMGNVLLWGKGHPGLRELHRLYR
jgi:hypothetical protein